MVMLISIIFCLLFSSFMSFKVGSSDRTDFTMVIASIIGSMFIILAILVVYILFFEGTLNIPDDFVFFDFNA